MGYFSNGTEGDSYEEKYCQKCIHSEKDCPILVLHSVYNYEMCNKDNSFLDVLIPRSADKLKNERCKMFVLDD